MNNSSKISTITDLDDNNEMYDFGRLEVLVRGVRTRAWLPPAIGQIHNFLSGREFSDQVTRINDVNWSS